MHSKHPRLFGAHTIHLPYAHERDGEARNACGCRWIGWVHGPLMGRKLDWGWDCITRAYIQVDTCQSGPAFTYGFFPNPIQLRGVFDINKLLMV